MVQPEPAAAPCSGCEGEEGSLPIAWPRLPHTQRHHQPRPVPSQSPQVPLQPAVSDVPS